MHRVDIQCRAYEKINNQQLLSYPGMEGAPLKKSGLGGGGLLENSRN